MRFPLPARRDIVLLIPVLLVCLPGAAFASDSLLTWKGEVRVRGEIDGRDLQHRTPPNLYSLLRTRLGAEVRPSKDLLISITLQDSRVFGQPAEDGTSGTSGNLRNIDLKEGYLRMGDLFINGLSVSVGRMGIGYGSERIVGYLDWSNTGRSFDGALLRFDRAGHIVDVFLHNIVEFSSPPSPVGRSTVTSLGGEGYLFWGGHYAYTGFPMHEVNLYGFHEMSHRGSSPSGVDRSRWTTGGRAAGSSSGFSYEAEGALQLGTQEETDVMAFLLAGNLGYSFGDFPVSSVMGGYEYLSGTPAGSEKVKSFEPMFPTSHRHWGIMDYFTSIPLQTFGRGLQDMFGRVVVRPVDGLAISVTGHDFRLAELYVGRRSLGQEIDLIGTFDHGRYLTFEIGGGAFFPQEIMEFEFSGEDPGLWGYAGITARF